MKIALFTPAWPGTHTPNGIATAVRHLRQGLCDIGHQVHIVAAQIDAPHETPHVSVVKTGPWSIKDRLKDRLGVPDMFHQVFAQWVAKTFAELHRAHGFDAIIMEETNGWVADVQAMLPIPVIVTLHGPWAILRDLHKGNDPAASDRRAKREARAIETCAGITAPSGDVLKTMQAAVNIPPKPQAVIANPFLVPAHPEPPCDDPASVLFVGRFDRTKGGDVVLAAFQHLIETHPNARLTFVGPDPGFSQPDGHLRHLADARAALSPRARDRITTTGPLPQDAIADLRRRHALVWVASRYEVFGYTVLEAMASGRAIISTQVGGPAEILGAGRCGLLVPSEDWRALAQATGQLIDAPERARRLGQAAHAYALDNFAPQAIAGQIQMFVKEVIA